MKLLATTLILLCFACNMFAQTKKGETKVKPKTNTTKFNTTKLNPLATALIGKWDLKQSPVGDGMNMMQTWEFSKQFFAVDGYPELKQKGMYKVIKTSGDTLTLKLFKQEGHWGTEDREQKIVFSKDKKSIVINNMDFRKKD